MRITDENGLFMETSVEVKVIDQFRPIVKTLDGLGENKDFDRLLLSKKSSVETKFDYKCGDSNRSIKRNVW